MENLEYNRLVFENRLDELANIWNITDLVKYRYLNKYLIEYLLEKDIHTRIMDNRAINDKLFLVFYIKYGITKPLVHASLKELLEFENNELLLDKLLEKMNNDEKIELYKNIKYTWLWLYRNKEVEILDIFKKHGIEIPRTFISLPQIADHNYSTNKKLKTMLKKFNKTYKDIDSLALKTYNEELKRSSKVDIHRTYEDIKKLIEYKKNNPNFKLYLNSFNIFSGEYAPDNSITIDKYIYGLFNHEFSHLLFDQYEEVESQELYSDYCKIRKDVMKTSTVNKIISYLKDLHQRIEYMRSIFIELYYHEINKQYGNFNNYCQRIYNELIEFKPEKMIIDDEITEIYIDYDNIDEAINELLFSECDDFCDICVYNYYAEELSLENLLDALLRGRIHGKDYNIECLSGHSKEYFKEDKYSSLDECLADYDTIKSSKKRDIIIDKLIELVGEDLVILLEKYLKELRGSKEKKKIKSKHNSH